MAATVEEYRKAGYDVEDGLEDDLSLPLECRYAPCGCVTPAKFEAVCTVKCPCGPVYLCPYHKEAVIAEDRRPGARGYAIWQCGTCHRELGVLLRIEAV